MQSEQGNILLSLQNVQTYLSENAARFDQVISAETRAALDDSLAELSQHLAVQNGHIRFAKGVAAIHRGKRAALIRDHMAPVARIAQLKLEDSPELVALSMPNDRPSAERLASLAYGMATAAEPHADTFIRAGCKPDFIQGLSAAADDMVQSLRARINSRGIVREATSALDTKLARARKVVKVIDGFIRSALANDPDALERWKLVKRVPKPHTGSGTPTAATPAPATGTPQIAGAPAPAPAPAPVAAAA